MEDFDLLGPKNLFLLSTLLRISRQDISSFVSLALTIIDPEVVTREFLSPVDLSGAQILYVYEPAEVVVVDEYDVMS